MTNFLKRIWVGLAVCLACLGARAEVTLITGTTAMPSQYSLVTSNSVNGDTSGAVIGLLPRCDLIYTITLTPPSTMATNYLCVSNVVVLTALSDGLNGYTTIAPLTNTITCNGTNVVAQRFFWSQTNVIGSTSAKIVGVTTTATNGIGVSVGYAVVGINH